VNEMDLKLIKLLYENDNDVKVAFDTALLRLQALSRQLQTSLQKTEQNTEQKTEQKIEYRKKQVPNKTTKISQVRQIINNLFKHNSFITSEMVFAECRKNKLNITHTSVYFELRKLKQTPEKVFPKNKNPKIIFKYYK